MIWSATLSVLHMRIMAIRKRADAADINRLICIQHAVYTVMHVSALSLVQIMQAILIYHYVHV